MDARILHVDVDAFFASVEQALNPALEGRPVIVGGDGSQKTVVASCSYEARARGVRTAMRTEEARQLCPEACFLPGDYRVYRRAADAVFARLESLSPDVEPVSLDEAYVDLGAAGNRGDGPTLDLAEGLCRRIRDELRLRVSIGIGTSRVLAKLATRVAKPHGCFLLRPGYERSFLHRLPVGRLPGVGPKISAILAGFNILRVGDLAGVPREVLVETFGRRGDWLFHLARGYDPEPLDGEASGAARSGEEHSRSVSRETSFDEPAQTHGFLFGMAGYLLERAMKEVIRQGLRARTVALKLQYADGQGIERAATLKVAAGHEANFVPVVDQLLRQVFVRRMGVRRIGVTLRGFVRRPDAHQSALFPDDQQDDEQRLERLEAAVALIRERHGFGAVVRGPAVGLLGLIPGDRDGFRLRIPSLTR